MKGRIGILSRMLNPDSSSPTVACRVKVARARKSRPDAGPSARLDESSKSKSVEVEVEMGITRSEKDEVRRTWAGDMASAVLNDDDDDSEQDRVDTCEFNNIDKEHMEQTLEPSQQHVLFEQLEERVRLVVA